MSKTKNTDPSKTLIIETESQKPLIKLNYIVMAIAGAMIVIGFLLMLGSSSTPDTFNPDIFSTRRIVIGPMIAFLGFVGVGVGIIIKPRVKAKDDTKAESTADA
jgi:hypothetical protein